MQVEYQLKIGKDLFTLKADVEDEKDFFEKMSFYSNLPRTGPNGEDDLKLVFRTTQEGHKYYSLVSTKADQEFKFGQNKDTKKGVLFPKGWEPLYKGNTANTTAATTAAPAGATPLITPQGTVVAPQAAVAPTAAPTPQPQATAAPTPQPQAPTQVAQPAAAPTPAANPAQVQQVATNVLAQFGIIQK